MSSALARVAEVKNQMEVVRSRRAQAEANLALVKTQLEATEVELRAIGVEPDNAENELAVLETQLAKALDEVTAKLHAELDECNRAVELTNEALK